MTEPKKPGEGEPAPYALPSWIDQAIARSKGDPPPPGADETLELPEVDQELETVSDDEPTAEYPALREAPPRPVSDSKTEVVPHFLGATQEDRHVAYPTVPEPHTVKVEKAVHPETVVPTPVDAPRGGAIPWIVAALFLTAAALVLAYLIWMRPTNA